MTKPVSQPTVTGSVGSAEGQWRGKALVKNNSTKKSATLDVDILAREPSQLRMELTASFGVHIASVALNGEEVRYLLTREKRFGSAPADANALLRLIPVRLPPDALLAVLFERPLPQKEWRCDLDPQSKLPYACNHKEASVVVRWLERTGRARHLKISSPEAEVEMVIDEAKSKVELNPNAFVLAQPAGYKRDAVKPD